MHFDTPVGNNSFLPLSANDAEQVVLHTKILSPFSSTFVSQAYVPASFSRLLILHSATINYSNILILMSKFKSGGSM